MKVVLLKKVDLAILVDALSYIDIEKGMEQFADHPEELCKILMMVDESIKARRITELDE